MSISPSPSNCARNTSRYSIITKTDQPSTIVKTKGPQVIEDEDHLEIDVSSRVTSPFAHNTTSQSESKSHALAKIERKKTSRREQIQLIFGITVILIASGTVPLVAKTAFIQNSYDCPFDETCELVKFKSFFALAVTQYVIQIILAGVAHHVLDYFILFSRGHQPIFCSSEDLAPTQRSYLFYSKFLITSLFDVLFTLCSRSSVMFIRASTFGSIGSLQIIVAAFADMVFSRRALTVGKVTGLAVIFSGVLIYTYGQNLIPVDGVQGTDNKYLGIGLAVISAVMRGLHGSLQGRFIQKHTLAPLGVLFVESVIALFYSLLFLAIATAAGVVNVGDEFWTVIRNPMVFLSVSLFGIDCFFFNGSAALIGKPCSALFRMIVIRLSAFMLWIIEMIIGWTPFTVLPLVGWLVVFFGLDLYAGIYRGFNKVCPFFFRPLLFCSYLVPTPGSILSERQRSRYYPEEIQQSGSDHEIQVELESYSSSKIIMC